MFIFHEQTQTVTGSHEGGALIEGFNCKVGKFHKSSPKNYLSS